MGDLGGMEDAHGEDASPASTATAGESAASMGPTCPWCSTPLGPDALERCQVCGAVLIEDPDALVPGVTTVDPEAVRRAANWERIRRTSSLRGFFETTREEAEIVEVQPSSLAALAPPSAEVRQEMERLRAELVAAAEREADPAPNAPGADPAPNAPGADPAAPSVTAVASSSDAETAESSDAATAQSSDAAPPPDAGDGVPTDPAPPPDAEAASSKSDS